MVEHFYPQSHMPAPRDPGFQMGAIPQNQRPSNYAIPVTRPEKAPGLGSMIAGAVGAGLGQGLGEGIQSSIKTAINKKLLDRAIGKLGPKASAKDIFDAATSLPPEAQQLFVQTYLPMRQQEQANEAAMAQQQQNEYQLNDAMSYLRGEENQEPQSPVDKVIGKAQPNKMQEVQSPEQTMGQQSYIKPQVAKQPSDKGLIQRIQNLTPAQQKVILEERKQAAAESKEFRQKLNEDHREYKSVKMRLDRMSDLNKKGKLSTPTWSTIVEKMGLPTSFLSEDSQEFQKLSNDLMKNIRTFFGARINQLEVQNFIKTIPTLSQSKEGRQRIINNLQNLSQAQEVYYDSYKEVMKGRDSPPLNLEELVNDRAEDKMDALALKFKDSNISLDEAEKISNRSMSKTAQTPVKKKDEIAGQEEDKKESMPQKILRNITRSGSRAGEAIAGIPGDLNSFANALVSKITPGKSPTIDDVKRGTEQLKKIFPTSKSLRDFSEKMTGGYTKPNSEVEKISDEIVSDVSSLATGGAGLVKAVGLATVGQLAKQGGGLLTDNEGAQNWLKMGSMMLGSMINPKRTQQFTNALYKEAESVLPHDAKIASNNLINDLDRTEDFFIQQGAQATGAEAAKKQLDNIRNIVKTGETKVSSLISSKINLNEVLGKIWDKKEKEPMLAVSKIVDKALQEYGQINPQYYEKLKTADAAFATLQESKKLANNLKHATKKIGIKGAGLAEMGLHYAGAPMLIPGALTTIPVGYPIMKTGEMMTRFAKNKEWRNLYTNVLVAGLKENSPALVKNLIALKQKTDELKEEE